MLVDERPSVNMQRRTSADLHISPIYRVEFAVLDNVLSSLVL
jgi:hypothetical protein